MSQQNELKEGDVCPECTTGKMVRSEVDKPTAGTWENDFFLAEGSQAINLVTTPALVCNHCGWSPIATNQETLLGQMALCMGATAG